MAMSLVVSLSPGPVMLLCFARGTQGPGGLVALFLGVSLGNGLLMAASLLGMASLLSLWPGAFTAISLAGAAYLMYLGWEIWRSPPASMPQGSPLATRWFWRGLWVAASNPKGLLYFAALLPPFLWRAEQPAWALLAMTCGFLLIDASVMALYAFMGRLTQRQAPQAWQQALPKALAVMVWLLCLLLIFTALR